MSRVSAPTDLTDLIGRDGELTRACELLGRARLLTLTGPGGIGKTRLAIACADRLQSGSNVETSWVDLGALQGPSINADRVYSHIALAVGMRQHDAATLDLLLDHFSSRRVLLVMDNCEHLVRLVQTVVCAILRRAPNVRILATSRERLRANEEHTLEVAPLALRDAVALFTARAATLGVDVTSPPTAAAVAELCRRLDGLPLPIRLAAGRVRVLSVQQMLHRLDDRFRLLSEAMLDNDGAARHAALERVVAWSYGLCDETEKLLWARASVFSSSFDLDAVEAVCAGNGIDPASCVDVVAALIDKSILTVDSSSSPVTYRLLETMREYGLRKLSTHGEVALTRDKHRRYYGRLVAAAATDWWGPDELAVMANLRRNLDDIVVAIDQCLEEGDVAAGRAIARDLLRAHTPCSHGFLDLAGRQLQRVLDASAPPTDADVAGDVAATAAMATWIAVTHGHQAMAHDLLAIAQKMHQEWDLPPSPPVLFAEGAVEAIIVGSSRSIGLLAQARAALADLEMPGDHHMATMMWAMAAAFTGDAAVAADAAEEYLQQAESAQAPWAISWALWVGGLVALRVGDHKRAIAYVSRGLRLQRDMDDVWGQTWSIELAAWIIAARLSQCERPLVEARRAAWLLGAARSRQQRLGVTLSGLKPFADGRNAALACIRAFLDDVILVERMEAGSRSPARVVQVALGEPTSRRRSASGVQQLTDREREIAGLVAQGLTSVEIGAQLGIAPRTVDVHAAAIRRKLGAPKRAAIGTLLAENSVR